MARIYAGILGPLAFLVALARGILGGGGAESVLWNAWCSLLVFAAFGCVIGWFAQRTIGDSVHGRIANELAMLKVAPIAQAAGPGDAGG